MADILAELEGILGADAVAKLRTNEATVTRLTKASELIGYYEGESDTPPAAPARREPPPAAGVTPPAVGGDSLAAIMARLDSFGNLDEKIKTGVDAVVQARGQELRGGAVADAIRITRDLAKIDARHRADFGEELDDIALNAYVQKATDEGRPFRTAMDAYEDMTRDRRVDKRVEDTVREKLKHQASGQVPGQSAPAPTPMLGILKGGKANPGDQGSKFEAAAAALRARQVERGEVAV
jgi:hypothetical protein